jgi:hypothetical protein
VSLAPTPVPPSTNSRAIPSSSAAQGPALPAPSSTVSTLSGWLQSGGQERINTLRTSLAAIKKAMAAFDATRARADCVRFESAVEHAMNYVPIPDDEIEHLWAAAMNAFLTGAWDCIEGMDSNNADLVTRSQFEMTEGNDQLSQVAARLGLPG